MFIYLDESGDLGFDFENNGLSSHFMVTLLVCYDYQTTLKFKYAVQHTLSRKLNNRKHRKRLVEELKSTQTTFPIKEYFYKRIESEASLDHWGIYSVILDKKDLLLKTKTAPDIHRLYNTLAHHVLSHIDFSKVNSSIQLSVDKWKSPKERVIFDHYLQNNLEAQLPLNITLNIEHERSHCNTGLQAVDLFSGGIFRKYAFGDSKWYDRFKKHIAWEGFYNF